MKKITSYPMLLGILIGILSAGGIMAMVIWFPWVGDAWDRHEPLVRTIFMTVFAFGVWLYGLWRWRYRRSFWLLVFIFFLFHAVGVLSYTIKVGPILVWQWLILLPLESYAIAFFVGWSTRRSSHLDRHKLE
jgi:hypothetical protein